jgi:hypothetical protein
MSLRPSIYAADIARFRAALTGDRAQLLKLVEPWYRERGIDDTAADISRNMDLLLGGAWAGQAETDQLACGSIS